MTFQARYPGRCPSCDERIHEGDSVRYEDDELVHAACDVPSPTDLGDDLTTVCQSCYMVHAGECF